MATKSSCVVMDNGSCMSKAGFSHEKAPSLVFPTKVGHPRHKQQSALEGLHKTLALEDSYVGDEAVVKRGVLSMVYPVEHGVVTNWEDMQTLWHYVYKKLDVSPEDQPLLLADAAINTVDNREKITEIMMETFKTPALLIANQGVLPLYAEGSSDTGVVVSCGGQLTQVVCTKGRRPLSTCTFELGGRDIDMHFARTLTKNGVKCNYQTFLNDIRKIKELFGYIALDCEDEIGTKSMCPDLTRTYTLLDEEVVTLQTERFLCPEMLFKPSLFKQETENVDLPSLQKACYDCIMACDAEIRSELFGNIVLSGGSTKFPGLAERLKKELEALASVDVEINIAASPNCAIQNVWLGGSIVASHPTFTDSWISRKEYEEQGASLVHKKYI